MPEIAEVEVIRQGLEPLRGQQLLGLEVSDLKLGIAGHDQLIGSSVVDLRRKGKLLGLEMQDQQVIAIHLRMTGNLSFDPTPRSRVTLVFTDQQLSFSDHRRFGTMDVVPAAEFGSKLGPDLFDDDLSEVVDSKAQRSRRAAKAVLLDQAVVAGIGNYLADEALWKQKAHPQQPWSDLGPKKQLLLLQTAKEIAKEALDLGGMSMRDYKAVDGAKGTMQSRLACYGRAGQPCLNCGTILLKTKVAGRGTTYCPNCQTA